jgi:hypothetical protein
LTQDNRPEDVMEIRSIYGIVGPWKKIDLSTLDEVEETPTPNLEGHSAGSDEAKTQALEPGIAPSNNPPNLAAVAKDQTIIAEVAQFMRRFVFLPDDSYYQLVATWVIATHLHDAVDYVGYLFAHSPERQSGKTTLLEILDLLVCNSTGLLVSPTEAVMFRMAHGHTHLLDEVDSWRDKDELKSVLNAGYKKSGVVVRCDKNSKGFKPTAFRVFAPRALAGIGLSILPETTLDRTFAISMVRQKQIEKRERFRPRVMNHEAAILKAKIENWVKANSGSFATCYQKGDFSYLNKFSDRTIDISEPLAAILEVVYSGTAGSGQARDTLVRAIASTRKEQTAPSPEHRILKILQGLATDQGPLIGNASELAAMCGNYGESIDQHLISQTLRKYEFKPKSIRKDGGDPLYRYELSKARLDELVDRWVPQSESDPVQTKDASPETGPAGDS